MSAIAQRAAQPTPERLALAARVAELRASGMTQREVAVELGISRGYAATLDHDPDGSKQLARRARYQGNCERCGAATDGSSGRENAPNHCAACSQAIRSENRKWSREGVIAAIQQWAAEHGGPPKATDWQDSSRDHRYPASTSVYRSNGWNPSAPFATWADAIEAAGFPRPLVGKREGDRHWSRELILEELHARAVGGFVSATGRDGFSTIAAYYFGSWSAACAAAGLRPASERRAREPEAASPHKEKGSSVGSR